MPIVDGLLDEGLSVQLKFLGDESQRDKVIIYKDDKELVSCHQVIGSLDFQHNRQCAGAGLRKNSAQMVEAIKTALAKADGC
mmetsp:Transcript_85518/g.125152  ORF Transcript_85518/g.125152 Transcript_85518/m.125152 type:complete len:82 (+) Transcript_85518:288-533(+)|eukprot:CAMPEP_0179444940 /NCGR_PEP_ID=MMETSP0799-20121207/28378_1 /TAXON_ID=46947 /ORGANISM="Geminigera cryophila, Strain CCMP2564" /LENGTH=81 /DNA_ID=CAMNT_0021232469 /DNA_START=151 /DNA_END=396 /DNA_ORIENTATION=-